MTFGADQLAIDRWRALVSWFELKTGLVLGSPPAFPPNVCHPPGLANTRSTFIAREPIAAGTPLLASLDDVVSIGPAWTDLDLRVAKVMADPIVVSAYSDDTDQWLRDVAGLEVLVEVQEAHRRLQEAAQAALDVEHDKAWGWRTKVPREAIDAAKLLAALPVPYREAVSAGQGDRILPRLATDFRRRLLKKLGSIQCDHGTLSTRELTVILLLTAPSSASIGTVGIRGLWTGWTGVPSTDRSAEAILKSDQFIRLESTVKKDRQRSGDGTPAN